MRQQVLVGAVSGAVLLQTALIVAGGWAVVTVENPPAELLVGKAMSLTFTVRQHGATPLDGLAPSITATSGQDRLGAAGRPNGRPGQYVATVTLPRPGSWVITIDSGFGSGSRLTLLPLEARAAAAPHARSGPADMAADGQRLFVAKGCVTCHQSDVHSENRSLGFGPALVAMKYSDVFLGRILADPAASLPAREAAVGRMPDLHLAPGEIRSLVAFINSSTATARR
jgi:mono/diheme cytochrome c family protein